jgi:antitoxin CcdA
VKQAILRRHGSLQLIPCALSLRTGDEEMAMLNDRPAKKRAVNLFVDAMLLDESRRLRINLSETLERRLRSIVRAEQERHWLEANRAALDAYNRRVAEQGLLSDDAGLL